MRSGPNSPNKERSRRFAQFAKGQCIANNPNPRLRYMIGRDAKLRLLAAATVVGLLGVAALAVYAIRLGSTWLFILGIFIVLNCWEGFKHSLFDAFVTDGVCPSCGGPDFLPRCIDCGRPNKVGDWALASSLPQHT